MGQFPPEHGYVTGRDLLGLESILIFAKSTSKLFSTSVQHSLHFRIQEFLRLNNGWSKYRMDNIWVEKNAISRSVNPPNRSNLLTTQLPRVTYPPGAAPGAPTPRAPP